MAPHYEQGTFTAGLRAETRIINDNELSFDEALPWVVSNLLPPGARPIESMGIVAGIVRDGLTNAPLSGISLVFFSEADQQIGSTTTNSSGTYSIELPAGGVRIEISQSGYVSTTMWAKVIVNATTQLQTVIFAQDLPGSGTVTGRVTNSMTGSGVDGASLSFRAGINSITGPVLATATTTSSGDYSVQLPSGTYTAEAAKTGFITGRSSVVAVGGQTIANQSVSISPVLTGDDIRIVLTWGAVPSDLDSHLTGPLAAGGRFHVYYSSKGNLEGVPYAALDVDDTSSYGPETVTITQQFAGVYRYSVHDYTNRGSSTSSVMSNISDATVKVFRGAAEIARFNVPTGRGGTLWTVFELNGTTGQITPINNFTFVSSSGSVTSLEHTDAELMLDLPAK